MKSIIGEQFKGLLKHMNVYSSCKNEIQLFKYEAHLTTYLWTFYEFWIPCTV